ncbi:uncharacterized protein LOC124408316 isoform X1 [Diprion similis]|uniref:uncharacterized protein LOC124408316 isoform X1 n=1 Tax=Diprion similis TaxID=362088 RepID=UPI001EF895C4|nr:uncharacterized protein LOC124408316 isoform X1 [Diprion similis]
MSFLMKSMEQFNYLSNKERENFFLSDDDEEDEFDFKYVPASQFKNVVKNVRRQKIKMNDERKWNSFVKEQELLEKTENMPTNLDPLAMRNIKEFLRENIGNVDRELKRLEEDAMPEINQIFKSVDTVKNAEAHTMMQASVKAPTTKETGTGSSNVLLTIPEEHNLHHTHRKLGKPKSKHEDNTRKSSSDHMVLRKNQSRKLLHVMDDSEYNSSPEPSPDRVSDKAEDFYARPDPIAVQRVLAIQKKVSSLLDEISFRLDRIPLPDGDRDLSRRLQRVAEFSVRFSRNYLYDLGRQITDMQQHIRAMSSSARPRPCQRSIAFHLQAVSQKLITAHQILLQGLSAYCKHIPSSIVKGHPGKLKEILQVVMDLKDICNKVNITSEHYGSGDADMQPLINETHKKCGVILSKLQLKGLGSDESQLMSHTTPSTTAAAQTSSRSRRRCKQKRLSSRLSMYSMEANVPKTHTTRRSSTCFTKEKKYSNTSSKFMHYNRLVTPKQPNPSPATVKSLPKEITRVHPQKVRRPPKEDNIRTMMDMLPPADSDVSSSIDAVPMNRYFCTNSMTEKPEMPRQYSTRPKIPSHRTTSKELQKVRSSKTLMDDQELTKRVTMITDEHLSSLVPVIADLMSVITSKQNDFEIRPVSSASMETLLEFLQKYQSPQSEATKLTSPNCNRSKEIRSGSKNMQLICMPYDEEKDKESKCSDYPCEINLEGSDETSEVPEEETTLRIVTSTNEIKKSPVQLIAPVSLDFIISEYHHRYKSFIQASPMYLSNTNNKPWDVVAWIADKLVDELIAEISKELQMDNIIQKMFDLEFEEF